MFGSPSAFVTKPSRGIDEDAPDLSDGMYSSSMSEDSDDDMERGSSFLTFDQEKKRNIQPLFSVSEYMELTALLGQASDLLAEVAEVQGKKSQVELESEKAKAEGVSAGVVSALEVPDWDPESERAQLTVEESLSEDDALPYELGKFRDALFSSLEKNEEQNMKQLIAWENAAARREDRQDPVTQIAEKMTALEAEIDAASKWLDRHTRPLYRYYGEILNTAQTASQLRLRRVNRKKLVTTLGDLIDRMSISDEAAACMQARTSISTSADVHALQEYTEALRACSDPVIANMRAFKERSGELARQAARLCARLSSELQDTVDREVQEAWENLSKHGCCTDDDDAIPPRINIRSLLSYHLPLQRRAGHIIPTMLLLDRELDHSRAGLKVVEAYYSVAQRAMRQVSGEFRRLVAARATASSSRRWPAKFLQLPRATGQNFPESCSEHAKIVQAGGASLELVLMLAFALRDMGVVVHREAEFCAAVFSDASIAKQSGAALALAVAEMCGSFRNDLGLFSASAVAAMHQLGEYGEKGIRRRRRSRSGSFSLTMPLPSVDTAVHDPKDIATLLLNVEGVQASIAGEIESMVGGWCESVSGMKLKQPIALMQRFVSLFDRVLCVNREVRSGYRRCKELCAKSDGWGSSFKQDEEKLLAKSTDAADRALSRLAKAIVGKVEEWCSTESKKGLAKAAAAADPYVFFVQAWKVRQQVLTSKAPASESWPELDTFAAELEIRRKMHTLSYLQLLVKTYAGGFYAICGELRELRRLYNVNDVKFHLPADNFAAAMSKFWKDIPKLAHKAAARVKSDFSPICVEMVLRELEITLCGLAEFAEVVASSSYEADLLPSPVEALRREVNTSVWSL